MIFIIYLTLECSLLYSLSDAQFIYLTSKEYMSWTVFPVSAIAFFIHHLCLFSKFPDVNIYCKPYMHGILIILLKFTKLYISFIENYRNYQDPSLVSHCR